MNIAIVTPTYPSTRCGISTYTGYLAAELAKLATVSIVGTQDASESRHLLKKITSAAMRADIIHVQYAFDLYGYMGYLTLPLYFMLKRIGKPVVTTIHELPTTDPISLKERIAYPYSRQLIRSVCKLSNAVIVHTQPSLDGLKQWGLIAGIHHIPHGITEIKIPLTHTDQLHRKTVGFFGFISEHKGVHTALHAIARLPGAYFRIAGEPRTEREKRYLAALKVQAVQLGIDDRVEFVGYVSDEELANFFHSVDVMLFPYTSCTASGALSLALAHGCVALTSDLPVFYEMTATYDCLETFKLNDPDNLTSKLEWLLSNTQRRSELVAGGQRLVAATSFAQVAQQTYNLYKELLASAPADELCTAQRTA